MRMHTFEFSQAFTRVGRMAEPFDDFLDRVIDGLDEAGLEADYVANLRELSVVWQISVPEKSRPGALSAASAGLRAALRSALRADRGWEVRGGLESVASGKGGIDGGVGRVSVSRCVWRRR